MRQHLMDIVLVIVCALGLFLTITWLQGSQEAPVADQLLHIIRQRGHITLAADRLLLDKARMQHTSGQSD